MSDYYYARYEHLSHQELYDMVRAGNPDEVDNLARAWSTLGNTAGSLASDLQRDLTALGHTWQGEAGAEFQRRLSAVVTFSDTLSTEFNQLQGNATYMAARLQEAQSKAEDPAATDDNDELIKGAAKGAVSMAWAGPLASVAGGIVGAIDGHSQDVEEQQRAHQRMITLVANLAGDYEQATVDLSPDQLQPAPTELPSGVQPPGGHAQPGPGGPGVGSGPGFGHAGPINHGTVSTSPPAQGPGTGTGLPGSGLAGVGTLTGAGQTPGIGTGPGGQGNHAGGELLAGAGGLAVGGLATSARGTMSPGGTAAGTTSGAAGSSAAPRPSTAPDSVLGREGETRAALTARAGAGPSARGAGGMGLTGRPQRDEPDERTTWLTEDDMDWGADDAAPPILGERPTGATDEETGAHRGSRPA